MRSCSPFGQLPGKGRRAGRDAPPGRQPIALAFNTASDRDRDIVRVDSVGLALALARKQLGPERDHEPRALSALPACHRDRDRFCKFDLARLFQWACGTAPALAQLKKWSLGDPWPSKSAACGTSLWSSAMFTMLGRAYLDANGWY